MSILAIGTFIGYLLIFSAIAMGLFYGFRAIKLI